MVETQHVDPVVLVQLRNQFYRKKFYLLLAIFSLCCIVFCILSGVLIYLSKHPTRPLYFVADNAGRLLPDIPLSQPNMSLQEVTAWAIDAIQSTYSYNYINFRSQLQESSKYFTQYGWQQYMRGLTASNNLLALQQRKMIFIAKVVQPPQLIVQGILGGTYAYKFEMAVLISYLLWPYDNVLGKSRYDNALIVDVIIQRQDMLSSYKGLGIVQLLAKSATLPAAQNLSTQSST